MAPNLRRPLRRLHLVAVFFQLGSAGKGKWRDGVSGDDYRWVVEPEVPSAIDCENH